MTKKDFIKKLKSDKQECCKERIFAITFKDNYRATQLEAQIHYIDCLLYWLGER